MSDALLLDTHIALWLETGDPRLRGPTRKLIDECWRAGGTIYLSAVSAWEIALLVDLGRFSLDVPVDRWIERFLGRSGVAAAPLSPKAAACSYSLPDLEHRDPGDRLLIATAIDLRCPLVTYDAPIVRFASLSGQKCGFSVLA